ncbi:protein HGV2-like isoform X2 [Branchiostoma lanceolatum]|uniref:protein HGV2-like isoform X2 n=1 Tax=Branchiostoma lanceolatum TaxID=7740 RepID=UPI003456E07E
MATDVAAPSTSSGSPSKDLDAEAKDLIGQGRRHLVMGEIPNAVNCFQECCGILAAKYGETADEVGEAYYLYGRSLIELARLETGVLGNALQGVPDESDSEAEEGEDSTVGNPDEIKDTPEEETDTDKKEAKDDGKGSDDTKAKDDGKDSDDTKAKDDGKGDADTEAKADGKKDEDPDTKADEKEEKKKDEEEEAEKEEAEDTGEEVSQDEDMETGEDQSEGTEEKDSEKESEKESEASESEDVGNLQLAWEVLELARSIYSKKEAKEDRLKLAQIYLHLGEIGLETEKYDQAAEDFMSCLKIQQGLLDAEDRLLAESHYQLGLAYSLSKDYDKSIEYYRNSHNVMKSRIGMLQGKIEELETGKGKESVSSDDPIVVHRKEVEELNALLPEISSKIEDAEEMKKGAEDEARAIMAAELGIGAGASSSSSAAPASTIAVKKAGEGSSSSSADAKPAADISHLVRKKRKPSDEEKENGSSDAKKPRQENGAGDEAAVNGTAVNGTATNGTATNGAGGSSTETSPEKDKEQTKITPKTVEDLKKDQESKKDTKDTETAAMETTS